MPPTRRRSGNTSTNQQSTLSFGGTQSRITKPTAATAQSAKDAAKPTSLQTTTSSPKFTTAKDLLQSAREGYTIPPADVASASASASRSQSQSPTTSEHEREVEHESETKTTSLPHHPAPATASEPASSTPPPDSASTTHARSLTTPDLQKYWSSLESSRKAPRVHQETTALSEKILRHFDLSSEYGPCIGISRMERWKRAEKLGLEPKVEVLAVLLREETGEPSRFDELLA